MLKLSAQGQLKTWNKVEAKDKQDGRPFTFFEYGVQTPDGSATVKSLEDYSKYLDQDIEMIFELKEFQGAQRLVLIEINEI